MWLLDFYHFNDNRHTDAPWFVTECNNCTVKGCTVSRVIGNSGLGGASHGPLVTTGDSSTILLPCSWSSQALPMQYLVGYKKRPQLFVQRVLYRSRSQRAVGLKLKPDIVSE
ncbi:hypothetical protein CBL_03765, partial [Carabus blaptoides fortunei]